MSIGFERVVPTYQEKTADIYMPGGLVECSLIPAGPGYQSIGMLDPLKCVGTHFVTIG